MPADHPPQCGLRGKNRRLVVLQELLHQRLRRLRQPCLGDELGELGRLDLRQPYEAEGEPADAVIWDELVSRTREESTLTFTFVMFLCIACLIAAVGVVTDSPVTVVGAMVVGPEFG
jgi:hypothetical protein